VDAEDRALVAGRTVTTLPVERRVDVLAPVDVVERAEEELPFGGAKQGQAEAPVRQADLSGGVRDLVAVVAVRAPGGGPLGAAQVERGGVVEGDRGRVTGGADARPVGVFRQQVPAGARPPLPVAAVVEGAEVRVADRAGVPALRPFAVGRGVTVAAV